MGVVVERASLPSDSDSSPGVAITSPPFVRAPAEDRSKYEKLTYNLDEISSSDDSLDSQQDAGLIEARKKPRKPRSIVPSLNKKKKRGELSIEEGNLSDDSIGSASDLHALNEDETLPRAKRAEAEVETISESVMTCGSSAYHAECESLTTREDEERPKKRATVLPGEESEGHDLLFVGHQYGEKPLLADDELDTEDDNCAKSPSSPRANDFWSNRPAEHEAADVFALAPFQKPPTSQRSSSRGSSRKPSAPPVYSQSRSQPTSQTVSPLDTMSRKSSLMLLSSNSPPVTPQLVDLSEPGPEFLSKPVFTSSIAFQELNSMGTAHVHARYENVAEVVSQNCKELMSPESAVRFENSVPHFATSVPPIVEQDEEPAESGMGDSKDLFGSSPFNLTNPFSSGSNVVLNDVTTPVKGFVASTPSPLKPPSLLNSPEFYSTPKSYVSRFPESPVNPGYAVTHSDSVFIPHVRNIPRQDLFGSVPFSQMLTEQPPPETLQRPTFLHISKTDSNKPFPLSATTCSHSSSTLLGMQTDSAYRHIENSSPDCATNNDDAKDTPQICCRKERPRSGDKSKYQLIGDGERTDKVNVIPGKLAQKSTKPVVVSLKKPGRASKKGGIEKAALAAGFSNMSFEDFPSDDGVDIPQQQMVAPFEVVRGDRQCFDGERRFGSLKRRSNPFS